MNELTPLNKSSEAQALIHADAYHFRVNTRAYTDSGVFANEMERVFHRSWIFVAHESELRNPGDFRTSYIGQQPVIVSRDMNGKIHVLGNRCVHRGSVVCRHSRGNVREFVCPYHGWTYGVDGKLTGVSERRIDGGYGPHFDEPEGLLRLPKVDNYRGFIFASFDPHIEPLVAFLGRARTLIDRKLDMSPVGEIEFTSKPYVVTYHGNWKFQSENIVDQYHFLFLHKGFSALQAKYGDSTGDFGVHKGGSVSEMRKIRYRGAGWGCGQGHGLSDAPSVNLDEDLQGPFAEFFHELLTKHGREELEWIAGKGAASIFPNFGLIHHQVRVWRPLAPDLTEVTVYPYELKGAPPALNEGMLRSQERFYGPAGHGMPDDVDVFAQNQQGLNLSQLDWLILERGLESDTREENGDYRGFPSSETSQRAFWRRWRDLMNA